MAWLWRWSMSSDIPKQGAVEANSPSSRHTSDGMQEVVNSFHDFKQNMHQQKWFHDLADALMLLVALQIANTLFRVLFRGKQVPRKASAEAVVETTQLKSRKGLQTTTVTGQNWTIVQGNGKLPVVLNFANGTLEECLEQMESLDIATESDFVNILIKCCSQEQIYFFNYGVVSAHLCQSHARWEFAYCNKFQQSYLKESKKPRKIRNVATLFAHLLATDSISWDVFQNVRLKDYDTSASSRLFLKTLFKTLATDLGIEALKDRIETSKHAFSGVFPTTNLRNARYAIQFLTSIGLRQLTFALREMVNAQKSNHPPTSMEDETLSSEASSINTSSMHSMDTDNMQNVTKTDSVRSERSFSSRGSSRTSYSTHRQRARQSFSIMDSPLISPKALRISSDGSQDTRSSSTNEKDMMFGHALLSPPSRRGATVVERQSEDEEEDDIVQSPLWDIREKNPPHVELPSLPLLVEEDSPPDEVANHQNGKKLRCFENGCPL